MTRLAVSHIRQGFRTQLYRTVAFPSTALRLAWSQTTSGLTGWPKLVWLYVQLVMIIPRNPRVISLVVFLGASSAACRLVNRFVQHVHKTRYLCLGILKLQRRYRELGYPLIAWRLSDTGHGSVSRPVAQISTDQDE